MEKSKTFRNLIAIIKWEWYNKQTCRVEIDSAVNLVLNLILLEAITIKTMLILPCSRPNVNLLLF